MSVWYQYGMTIHRNDGQRSTTGDVCVEAVCSCHKPIRVHVTPYLRAKGRRRLFFSNVPIE